MDYGIDNDLFISVVAFFQPLLWLGIGVDGLDLASSKFEQR